MAQLVASLALSPGRLLGAGFDTSKHGELLKQIHRDGFAVLPDHLSALECQVAIGDFERAKVERAKLLLVAEDERFNGFENYSRIAERFHNGGFSEDISWTTLAGIYAGCEVRALHTLANKIVFDGTDKFGSGGCWHRDGFAPELKVIVYLNDVTEDNGPFQLIRGSHRLRTTLADMRTGKLEPMQNRLGEAAERILKHAPDRLVSFTAPRGTAILFDDSCIHRGAPLHAGERYALTNYYCDRSKAEKALPLYEPLLRH